MPKSYGGKTYTFNGPIGTIAVWRQKLNGFQHMYGSAIACDELGEQLSDLLFRLNEFAEFSCDWNGVEPSDLLDRKKDLSNNKLGRSIALNWKKRQPLREQQDLAETCAWAVENDPLFLAHFLDPRVFCLSESQFGCGNLPRQNVFNLFRRSLITN